jgi:hypothetical protein
MGMTKTYPGGGDGATGERVQGENGKAKERRRESKGSEGEEGKSPGEEKRSIKSPRCSKVQRLADSKWTVADGDFVSEGMEYRGTKPASSSWS